MPEIHMLSASVINKIAAGEVIERPASVVKELMENSVDAGAKRIDVTIEKGGEDLIRVSDNGCGVTPAQLPLAIASHATSKIRDSDDLFEVRTLGFRGEALASISEVSHFRFRSRTRDADAGAELDVNGGKITPPEPCGCPPGTTVEVRRLFFNTPVRKKFLRTAQTEMGHITEAFQRIALPHPEIHFTLRHNSRMLHDLPPTDNWRQRIGALFGSEIEQALLEVESDDGLIQLNGYAADPKISRGNQKMQYLFLNGRHIRDRSLQHALGEAYRGLLLTGRHPVAFLRLQIPAELIDVNVHPTKLEVRFQDGGRVYSQLLSTLRRKFLNTDMTSSTAAVESAPAESAHDPEQAQKHRDDLVKWAQGQLPDSPEPTPRQGELSLPTPPAPSPSLPAPTTWSRSEAAIPKYLPPDPSTARTTPPPPYQDSAEPVEAEPVEPPAAPRIPAAAPAIAYAGMQVQNRYLITETENGMLVIDQHALHERILYEQFREKAMSGRLDKQRLLTPQPVDLQPAEAAAVLEAEETLDQLGVEVRDFGGGTVAVGSYPAALRNADPAELLRRLSEMLTVGGKTPDRRDVFEEMLQMMSCKAAVKAGDPLSPEEISALLEQRHLFHDTHHCPHGRPTALVFTNEELDKRFKRT